MNNLSKDLISYIYQYISLNDIYNCSMVNKQFNKAFHHELLWKNLCNPYKGYIDKYILKIKKNYQEIYKIIIENINSYLKNICIYSGQIKEVPIVLINGNFYMKAVKENGCALQYVSENLKDKEICLEAVKENGSALRHVPERLIDKEICVEAVKQNGFALRHVPERLKNIVFPKSKRY